MVLLSRTLCFFAQVFAFLEKLETSRITGTEEKQKKLGNASVMFLASITQCLSSLDFRFNLSMIFLTFSEVRLECTFGFRLFH